jgi:hypothetical protein
MRRFILSIGSAVLLLASPLVAQAQPTKTVSGTISEIAADAITVKADGKDMKFVIDGKTQVITPGGGTKTRAAETTGKGVGAMDVLKVGQAVEIRYHEQGMHAASIRTIASVPGPASPAGPKAMTASGVVASISGSSLVVKGASAELTFAVDEKTTVIGTGVGTAGEKAKSEGKKPTLSELLHEGDTVSVTYHDVDGTKHASVVRITKRKT